MRIGIDARELCGRPTGVGRYLRGLLDQWATSAYADRHEFVLYTSAPLGVSLDARRFPTRLAAGTGGTWWEQIVLPKVVARDHVELLFAPAYTAPLVSDVPTVVAIHDLSFAARPEWFTMREGMRRRWVTRRAAQRARAIITISEFSRRELVERFGVPESHIHVIPPGITMPPGTPTRGGQRTPTVLYVGTILNRRHLPDLIRAFAPIARGRPDVALEIVGDNRSFPPEDLDGAIESEAISAQAHWRRYIDEQQLRTLYGSARAFAFLSEYEGLGLTPLEALAAGTPSVLLDTAVARESCGEAALYVPVNDIPATTRALTQLLFDDLLRARLLAAAPGVLARYDWPRAARDTLAVMERA